MSSEVVYFSARSHSAIASHTFILTTSGPMQRFESQVNMVDVPDLFAAGEGIQGLAGELILRIEA
jgi:hypothetical protein